MQAIDILHTSEQNEEQEILAHIVQQRQKEGLPSFFALLSGPTFLKFRSIGESINLCFIHFILFFASFTEIFFQWKR
jgi:hypothetical protein